MEKVLVTGAGGSIGSELVLQLSTMNSSTQLILNDISEVNLFEVGQKLIAKNFKNFQLILGDIGDSYILDEIFQHRISKVYHAAAYKHVNLSKYNPNTYFRNNFLGLCSMLERLSGLDTKFTLISTDKAVEPINPMGMSKRLCEFAVECSSYKLVDAKVVRFGNVLNSSGSVVPLFQQQIKSGGPLLITHPDAERYFMSIAQAVSLVLETSALSRGTYILDMGKPIKIIDLAYNIAAEKNLRLVKKAESPDEIEIKFIGLREGEKLQEELTYGSFINTEINSILKANEQIKCDPGFISELINIIKCGKSVPTEAINWRTGEWLK